MNHLCFVVDNSMTMSQRGSNGMALLDYAKSAIETVMRKLGQGGYPGASDHVHLYVTSLPSQALSSFEHDQSHLECQVRFL